MFLTGSAGTGKTLVLCEALKIKLSKLKYRGKDVKIFVTTFNKTASSIDAIAYCPIAIITWDCLIFYGFK